MAGGDDRLRRRREPLRARPEPAPEAPIDLTAPAPVVDLSTTAPGRRRILIVDDEPDVYGYLRIALEPLGWDTNGARNVADGLEMAVRLLPDVVLLDQRLPDGTGLELGRWLRVNQPSMVLIMFSAHLDLPMEEEAASIGIMSTSKVDQKALMATLAAIRDDLDARRRIG